MVKWSLESSHFFFLPYNDPDLHGLQGYQAVQLLHTALGSPSTPQATPTPLPRGAKTFQKAKSMLSFRHQSSTAAAPAASFGTGRSSMLPAAHLVPAQGKAFPPADYCLTSATFCCFWAIYKAQQCRPFPYLTPFLCVQKARQCLLFLFFKPVLAPWRQSLALQLLAAVVGQQHCVCFWVQRASLMLPNSVGCHSSASRFCALTCSLASCCAACSEV